MGQESFWNQEEISSIDELFRRSRKLRSSKKFIEFVNFISRFKKYSIFNNAIVFLQNPEVSFYATAAHWKKEFGREVKRFAKAMVILAPMTPILFVYDLEDTEGPDLPEYLRSFFEVKGNFSDNTLTRTINNCKRDSILVERIPQSFIQGGFVTRFIFREKKLLDPNEPKIYIGLNDKFENVTNYATLVHELAHIYLGHLGNDEDEWWPNRQKFTRNQFELEAEATKYIVCRRIGLETKSAEYLAIYLKDEKDLEAISIDWIIKTAGLIERMGEQKLPERRSKSFRPF